LFPLNFVLNCVCLCSQIVLSVLFLFYTYISFLVNISAAYYYLPEANWTGSPPRYTTQVNSAFHPLRVR